MNQVLKKIKYLIHLQLIIYLKIYLERDLLNYIFLERGNYDTFNIRDLKKDQEKIKIMFSDKINEAIKDGENKYHYIRYNELYKYVDHRVKTDDNILIGDIIFEAQEYESRPYYGLNIVSYDLERKCKIYNSNEGMPYIKYKEQIIQLKKNNVTYDNIVKYSEQLPDFEWWKEFYYSWVQQGIYEEIY